MTPEIWWMLGAACGIVVVAETIARVVPTTSSNPEPAEGAQRPKRYGLYTFEE